MHVPLVHYPLWFIWKR